MQSVLKKMAFSAGALALSVGLSACGKLKDMPSSGKQSQTEAPAGDVVPKSFQGIWSHVYHVYPVNEKDGTPDDGESHFKIEADGTLYQLDSFQVVSSGSGTPRVSMKYKVVGKLTMQTPHSARLTAYDDLFEELQGQASKMGVWRGDFEIIRHTSQGAPQICILAWQDDRGGFLDSDEDYLSDTYCYSHFDQAMMDNYFREKAKQGSGH